MHTHDINKRYIFSHNHIVKLLPFLTIASILLGCDHPKERAAPLPVEEERKTNFGQAFGEEFLLFGRGAKRAVDQTSLANVNAYLWQASLETIAFLPLQATDATGGVIITDWYAVPQTPHERLKITIRIVGKDLRSDALRVSINRQILKGNAWIEVVVHEEIKSKLENIILSKARELRINSINSPH